jgi:hypothetical protein
MLKDYLDYAEIDNMKFGVRAERNGVWMSGIFSSRAKLMEYVDDLDGDWNIYMAVNRLDEAIKATNKLERCSGTIRNEDFSLVTRIVFDIDSERKSTPATEEELQGARSVAKNIIAYTDSLGWTSPVWGFSGNGYHLIWRCRIKPPAYNEVKDDLYYTFQELFGEQFDVSVRNIGRIIRLYGTMNVKGNENKEEGRVFRRSTCKIPPKGWNVVTLDDIKRAIKKKRVYANPAPQPQQSVQNTVDIVELFVRSGLYVKQKEPGIHIVRCPWENEHTTNKRNGTYILSNRGYDVFYCHHSHCSRRRNKDVLRLLCQAYS